MQNIYNLFTLLIFIYYLDFVLVNNKANGGNCLFVYSLQKELMGLMMNMEKGVSAFPDGENLFKWIGTINGPKDTV